MTGHCAFTSYFLLKEACPLGLRLVETVHHEMRLPGAGLGPWDYAPRSSSTPGMKSCLWSRPTPPDDNLAAVDPSRCSPDGKSAMAFEIENPVNLRRYGGIQAWENREITDQLDENHLGQIEALAPGFRELVLASSCSTPLDNWRRNPSAIYGHELGGDASGAQWYMGGCRTAAALRASTSATGSGRAL